MLSLTLEAARALHLAAQGLLVSPKTVAKKADVLQTIQAMGALQIDTINVVARSPYLVLWSRLGDYPLHWLDELLEEGAIFEYWSHEACFLPIEDYGLHRHQMVSPEGLGWKYNHRWLKENAQQVENIRRHIHQHGACRSADFTRTDGKGGGWWSWKPEKRSLEVLFTLGELMVARRHNFQRIYDLRERVHPKWSDERHLQPQIACQEEQVLKAVKALGICKANWVADYFRMKKLDKTIHPAQLAESGKLLTVRVENWDELAYVHPDHRMRLVEASQGKLVATATSILSPFDPVVWDRKRAKELFNFDYKIECYTPEAKRQFGYFTLPILRRGELIGRMDAKAHRKSAVFEVKAVHLENHVSINEALATDLVDAIKRLATWHGANKVDFRPAKKETLLRALEKAW